MSKFVPSNDPILTKVAKQILKSQINSQEIGEVIKTMRTVAHGEQKNKQSLRSGDLKKGPVMVGLAAPQIGISKRIILVDVAANGKGRVGDLRIYINAQIIWRSKKEEEWYEGCYSTSRVCGIVSRPISIKIKAWNVTPQGCDIVEEKYSGYVARIFQHEIDHLNGKRFPDLIKEPDKLHWVLKKEFPLYRKGAWKNWPKKWKNPLLI